MVGVLFEEARQIEVSAFRFTFVECCLSVNCPFSLSSGLTYKYEVVAALFVLLSQSITTVAGGLQILVLR